MILFFAYNSKRIFNTRKYKMQSNFYNFLLFLSVFSFYQINADTPGNCSYEDIRGSWKLYEFVKGQDKTVDCTYVS
jgi:hypothetical protein